MIFKFIVEEDEIDHNIINTSGDEQPIDVAKIITPEAVRVQAELSKSSLKRAYYLANKEAAAMKDNLSHMVVSPINRFFYAKEYHVWKNFSYFIHNKFQIDDCAILSKVEHQEKAVTFIRRKINFGKDYFELTYKFGYIELLAASGFFGSVDDTSFFPFLRSSIQELPATITTRLETISIKVVFITNVQKHIFAGNRDEFLRRPTARARFWEEADENILGGIDLEYHPMDDVKNGTWLGINRQGKFAALTNFRENQFKGTVSRGALVKDFLWNPDSVDTTLEHVKERENSYGGFSLRKSPIDKIEIERDIRINLGLSNSILTNPWPKVIKGKEMFKEIIKKNDKKDLIESLFEMLKTGDPISNTDDTSAIRADFKERIFIPKVDFPPSIELKELSYGTRTSTIVLLDYEGNVTFIERDWYDSNLLPIKSGEYDDRLFEFHLQDQ
ncbi:hypothetical protein G6F17_008898 [Rhizopus arrhizus]|nr:hypothetical protein G6F21_003507 [Rhizopus arrhizus]KAG0800873.1 hypothetical protein G6F22_001796 [Rhizopus arrhizus]KAG0809541.1 hypothetical protein G6F20_008692 [Rhizopus arrhizus]KAG0828710.1 hypothetical protein G6F18_008951 [Rhizopus arrhizus]KAG0843190.1 hypothetical protein G6F19_000636 [Rhizopus arrhizus]